MSFENPTAFFLLFTIPFILLFHLFKVRRPEVEVGSLLFWEEELRELRRNVPFRRLRPNLLLLLQLLAILFVSLALAKPVFLKKTTGYQRTVLILDTSASMQATDVIGGRFQAARAKAFSLVEALRRGQKMAVVEAGFKPQVLLPFTEDKATLRKAIEGLQPKDFSGRLSEALSLASTLIKSGPPANIHVLTDGAFDTPKDSGLPIHWHTFGQAGRNVGILAFEARKTYHGSFDYQIFLTLANYGKEAAAFDFKILLDERLFKQQKVILSPNVKRSFVFPLTYEGDGVLKAVIELQDDFLVDNTAFAILPATKRRKVLLVSAGNLFLEKALASDPQVQMELRNLKSYQGPQGYDVVIFDRSAPKQLPPGRYLLINTLPQNVPLKAAGSIQQPQILDWDHQHPVMRYLDFSRVLIQEAMKVEPLSDGRVLLESSLTPLIYAFEENGLKAIFVGFDLYKSDLPLRVAFPLFISNALNWLPLSRLEAEPAPTLGQAISFELPPNLKEASIIDPEGKAHGVPLEGGRLFFPGTSKTGVYTVKVGGEEQRYALNLFDEGESNIIPRAKLLEDGEVEASAHFQRKFELWPFFATLAIMILLLEGFLYIKQGGLTTLALLRGLVLLSILLALFRPKLPLWSDRLNVLFLVDVSDSVSLQRQPALTFVDEATRLMGKNDTAGLILFGEEPSLAVPPEKRFHLPEKLPPPPGGRATDIEEAIQLALATFPQGGKKRLVLLSDGNENQGSALEAARTGRAAGVEIYSFPLRQSHEGEVLVEGVILPQEVKQGESFILKVVAWSDQAGTGRLSLYRDGTFVGSHVVRLKPGKNVLAYHQALKDVGFHLYQATLEAKGDTIKENNRAIGLVAVLEGPHVLYVEKDREQGQHLIKALRAQDIPVEMISPEKLPTSLDALLKYDLLILSNVSSIKMTNEQMELIRSYVGDYGGGLIMLGGEESFGVGGYYRTPVEEALPVTMETRQKLEVPSLAIVLLIDRSGSMGGGTDVPNVQKLDLAKEAAQLVIELLDERSEVGVIAFDVDWSWVVPLGPAKARRAQNEPWTMEEIATIRSGGGTNLFPPLKEAYQALYDRKALTKHIIILSDGQTTLADFVRLVRGMTKDKITVTTVAIGRDADLTLMQQLSRLGRGRFYYTNDPQTIPRIFTLETQLASKSALVEQPFRPLLVHPSHEILQEIDWAQVPPLEGYVATTPKTTADVLLLSPQQDPILAVWRYGVGRGVAFTSDLKAKWGTHWLNWPGFNKFVAHLIRWTLRIGGPGEILTSVVQKDGKGEVVMEAVDQNGEFINFLEAKAGIVYPDKGQVVIPLVQVAPGRYAGSFQAEKEGAYLVGITGQKEGKKTGSELASLVIPYPPELRTLEPNRALLKALGSITGGSLLENASQVFQLNRKRVLFPYQAWPWLLMAALALFLLELALRLLSRFRQAAPVRVEKRMQERRAELYVARRERR